MKNRHNEDMDGTELLMKWQDLANVHHFEGDPNNLEKLVEALGYTRSGFRFGEPIERFLADNPGAQEAIVSWIEDQLDRGQEFAEALEKSILELEPEEEGLFSNREDDDDGPDPSGERSPTEIAYDETDPSDYDEEITRRRMVNEGV